MINTSEWWGEWNIEWKWQCGPEWDCMPKLHFMWVKRLNTTRRKRLNEPEQSLYYSPEMLVSCFKKKKLFLLKECMGANYFGTSQIWTPGTGWQDLCTKGTTRHCYIFFGCRKIDIFTKSFSNTNRADTEQVQYSGYKLFTKIISRCQNLLLARKVLGVWQEDLRRIWLSIAL